MQLTDKLIQTTVDNITGVIVANVAEQHNTTGEYVMSQFIRSKTYAQLMDKETGMYWDSISETIDMFLEEINQEQLPLQ